MPDTSAGPKRAYATAKSGTAIESPEPSPRRDYAAPKRLGRTKERRFNEAGQIPGEETHENPRNTMFLLGALVLLIIIIAGAFIMLISQKGGNVPIAPGDDSTPPDTITPPSNQTEVCDDECHLGNALSDEDAEECREIISTELMEDCFEELSDVSFEACTSLDSSKNVDCITAFAVADSDPSICDLLADPMPCRKLIDPCIDASDQTLCHALSAEDPSLCKSDTDCLLEYSFTKDSVSSCALIQDPTRIAFCESVITNQDGCASLPTQPMMDECHELVGIETNDFAYCEGIVDKTNYGMPCVSSIAVSLHDLDLCDKAGLPLDDLWACYRAYALGSGDLQGCERIHLGAPTNRFLCAFEYAKLYGDPSACQVIVETLGSRSTCYQGAIIYSAENLTWTNCAGVTDFDWRNKCYVESAKKEGDVSICDMIETEYARTSCKDSYALYVSNQ